MFPKIGVPPKSSILIGFSMKKTIHSGVPLFLETPKSFHLVFSHSNGPFQYEHSLSSGPWLLTTMAPDVCRWWPRQWNQAWPWGLEQQQKKYIHPGRLTWTIIMEGWKIIFLSKWVICRFHVNLPGCNKNKNNNNTPPKINESNLKPCWFGSDDFPLPGLSCQVPAVNLPRCNTENNT